MDNLSPSPRSPIPKQPHSIIIAGDLHPSGAYILRVRLHDACDVSFGRFDRGRPVTLPAGDYVYIGSAMGRRGSSTLANRLLRHARRADVEHPQAIYPDLATCFAGLGWTGSHTATVRRKSLRWHIDYLLEQPEAELKEIYIICCQHRIEPALAAALLADPVTHIVVPGLGASDDRGGTHLLLVEAQQPWWQGLTEQMLACSI